MSAAKTPEKKPKVIHLDAQPAPRDQLLRLPIREDPQFSAGDLIWAKVRLDQFKSHSGPILH